jgi:integral membrane sensor domain MASE1
LNVLMVVVGLIGGYLTIRYVRFPFVLLSLLLLSVAFRLGGLGASLMSLCVGLMITSLWILGIRPIGLVPTPSTSGTLIGFPVMALPATLLPYSASLPRA